MTAVSRREWLCAGAASLLGCAAARAPAVRASRPTDARLVEVHHSFEEFRYRAPYRFGGRSVDRVTLLNVTCRLRTDGGREAWGFGSMTLGNAWAFPAASQDAGLGAMKALAQALEPITAACDERGHPLDLARVLEPAYLRAAADVSARLALPVPIPKLCTLVVGSAYDAALHDAYGKAFGVSVYQTYGPTHMRRDLAADLGPGLRGRVPRSVCSGGAAAGDAGVPLGRRRRSAGGMPTSVRRSATDCPRRSRRGSRMTG